MAEDLEKITDPKQPRWTFFVRGKKVYGAVYMYKPKRYWAYVYPKPKSLAEVLEQPRDDLSRKGYTYRRPSAAAWVVESIVAGQDKAAGAIKEIDKRQRPKAVAA